MSKNRRAMFISLDGIRQIGVCRAELDESEVISRKSEVLDGENVSSDILHYCQLLNQNLLIFTLQSPALKTSDFRLATSDWAQSALQIPPGKGKPGRRGRPPRQGREVCGYRLKRPRKKLMIRWKKLMIRWIKEGDCCAVPGSSCGSVVSGPAGCCGAW